MKHLYIRLLSFLVAITGILYLTSCDKLDDNGPFCGYWLLTDIEGPDGALGEPSKNNDVHVNTDIIDVNSQNVVTISVRNELLVIHDMARPGFYFCTFTRDSHSLQLLSVYYNDGSNDSLIHFEDIPASYYVPADGHYDIVNLDSKSMILAYDNLTLTFKKN